MIDFIIIGAGISGLTAAKNIKEIGLGSVLVLEKSRGVGGRMATRRNFGTRFDHGAQFYRLKSEISKLHQIWTDQKINHQWFVSSIGNHWCGKDGMTALIKSLANNIDIQFEKQIQSIRYDNNCWTLVSNKNEEWTCLNLIFTAPLPQALLLLKDSAINIPSELSSIQYTKALVLLITLKQKIQSSPQGYKEFIEDDFFSISDQESKGVSSIPALTLTMSADFSEENFDKSDEEISKKILDHFTLKYPESVILDYELKKWRYCKATSTATSLFSEVRPGLFLIGDAFGGSSILGSIRSSDALINYFLEKE
jgi:predicted NAD/FAD-dependent oxidoreductase